MGFLGRLVMALLCAIETYQYAAFNNPYALACAVLIGLLYFSILADTKDWK